LPRAQREIASEPKGPVEVSGLVESGAPDRAATTLDAQPGHRVGGRYLLGPTIGRGGAGAVHLATREDTGAEVAIKILRRELADSPEMAARFAQEARAAAKLDHPGIVRVLDFGEDPAGAYLVMERIVGESLADVIARGRLAPQRAVDIILGILSALAHAHAEGVVHRDLKPGTIMLGPAGEVKLLDFGVARVINGLQDLLPAARSTMPGVIVGTPDYLSPEQALGEPGDARADLYAVGVLLYEMLAGRRPLTGETRHDVLAAHVSRPPRQLRELAPEVSTPALEAVIERALAKDRGLRFQRADELAVALIAATRSAGEVASSLARRVRLIAIAVLICALITAVSLLIGRSSGGAKLLQRAWTARAAELEAVREPLGHGEIERAVAAATGLVANHPDDPRAFALLGHALMAGGEKHRALAAYREAARLDPRWTAFDGELRANLRATFADKLEGEPALALAETLGPLMAPAIVDFADTTKDQRLERRARAALDVMVGAGGSER
jgi:hypothetical protein